MYIYVHSDIEAKAEVQRRKLKYVVLEIMTYMSDSFVIICPYLFFMLFKSFHMRFLKCL